MKTSHEELQQQIRWHASEVSKIDKRMCELVLAITGDAMRAVTIIQNLVSMIDDIAKPTGLAAVQLEEARTFLRENSPS